MASSIANEAHPAVVVANGKSGPESGGSDSSSDTYAGPDAAEPSPHLTLQAEEISA